MTRLYVAAVYLGLWAVAVTAPPADAGAVIADLLRFEGPDPWSVAVFNLMGVWPILFAAPLLWDGPGQRLAAWPFVALSFVAGAFVLGLYLLARREDQPIRPRTPWLMWMTHRNLAFLAGAMALGLLIYASTNGSISTFGARVASDGFVRTYTADFVAFSLLYPIVAFDDRRRLNLQSGSWTVLIPLLGATIHMVRRYNVLIVENRHTQRV